jgi:uncharacterized membrane-anchored protein YjiN (DUF445 family)
MPPKVMTPQTTSTFPQGFTFKNEALQRQRLWRNRALANTLLGTMAGVTFATHLVEAPGFAVLLLRAGAEAGVVGGLADWFAVTALFRHPLGIPIPHTAIIPNSRERIARTLGVFIEEHFLTPEVVLGKLRALRIGRRFAVWLGRRSTAAGIADAIIQAMPYVISSLGKRDLLDFANRTLGEQLRRTDITPVLARIVEALTKSGEADVVFDQTLGLAEKMLQENSERIEEIVQQRSRWWIPSAINKRIANAMISGVLEVLQNLREPESEARLKFRESLSDLVQKLQTSPELQDQINAAKNRLLDHPDVQAWIGSIWTDLSAVLLRDLESPSSKTREALESVLVLIGQALLSDEAMQKHIDSALERLSLHIVRFRGEIGSFFSDVVMKWDTRALSDRLELLVGSDLQYIRMNGTVVGALVGCLLFLMTRAIS